MVQLADGGKVTLHRNGAGYVAEHRDADGILRASFECDTLAEARAALHYGPSRW